MNIKLIAKILGIILLALSGCFVLCLWVDLCFNHQVDDLILCYNWACSFLLAFLLGALLAIWGYNAPLKLFRQEALVVLAFGWIIAVFIGSVPYFTMAPELSYIDCFFESTSGLTTTGASVIPHPSDLSPGLQFWRSISQWLGGLGLVVFFASLLSSLGAGTKILINHETSLSTHDVESGKLQKGLNQLFFIYCALTFMCGILYYIGGMDSLDSICHAMTTLATGGFSTSDTSLAGFKSPTIEWTAVVFMLLGATNFFLLSHLVRGHWHFWKQSTEAKVFLTLVISACLIALGYTLIHFPRMPLEECLRTAIFQTVSIATTTGYATSDYNLWHPTTHVLLLALMVLGGPSSSTAGGLKIIRSLIAFKVLQTTLEKSYRPRIVRPVKINGKLIDLDTQNQVMAYLVLVAFSFAFSWVGLSMLEPELSFKGQFSVVTATIFNIGPALAEIGPFSNYSELKTITKSFLSFLMILGRLEFYAVLVLFVPSMWKGYA